MSLVLKLPSTSAFLTVILLPLRVRVGSIRMALGSFQVGSRASSAGIRLVQTRLLSVVQISNSAVPSTKVLRWVTVPSVHGVVGVASGEQAMVRAAKVSVPTNW